MNEKRFEFGVDIPTKITKYKRRFVDLEGFLDENYEGEHHSLWDNQEECWCHLDDALCLMEKEYRKLKEENEELRTFINKGKRLSVRELMNNANENELLKKYIKGLEKKNEQLLQLLAEYRKTNKHLSELCADASKNGYLPPLEEF